MSVKNKINSIAPIHDYDDWDFGLFTSDENQNGDLLFEKELEEFQKETEGRAGCCGDDRIFFTICCSITGIVMFLLPFVLINI